MAMRLASRPSTSPLASISSHFLFRSLGVSETVCMRCLQGSGRDAGEVAHPNGQALLRQANAEWYPDTLIAAVISPVGFGRQRICGCDMGDHLGIALGVKLDLAHRQAFA